MMKHKNPTDLPFGIEWEGYLHIPQKGVYQFATKSDDGSVVYIDGNLVVDNDDLHALRHISGVASLDEGVPSCQNKIFRRRRRGRYGIFMDAAWWKRVACSGSCPIS